MAVAFFAAATIPRAVPAIIILAGSVGLAVLLIFWRAQLQAVMRTPAVIAISLFAVYLFINSMFALNPQAALQKSLIFILLAAATFALVAYFIAARPASLRRVALFAVAGLLAGLGILLIELVLDQPIWRFVHNNFPDLAGGSRKHVNEVDGKIVGAATYLTNRSAADVVMLFWPAILLAAALPGVWRIAARLALTALVVTCALISESQTSMVALGLGLIIYAIARLSLTTVRWMVVSVWVAGLIFAIPLGAMPHKLGWTSLSWMSESAAARFYIWSYTADKALENPLTGIGVRGTRELQATEGLKVKGSDGRRLQPRPGRHAHNAFLQIWLELGAVGAALLLGLGLALLRHISRLPHESGAIGYALFTTICGVAAFGFGIWQTWLLGAIALSALGYLVGAALDHDRLEAIPQGDKT